MKAYVCRRMRLLQYLKKRGFLPFETRPDSFNPRYRVWIFEPTKELLDCVDSYYNGRKALNK